MSHDTSLITTIVAGLVLAFLFGTIANRLRMPPLVGYLVAGVLVGPHSPGFIADQTLAPQLAEIGVILLMFGVGLEFSLRDLLSVRAVAIPGALIRILAATALGYGLATLMGWVPVGGLVFGLALSVSSTVVLLKALQERHLVDSDRGRIAIGWLVVEDLAMVLALVLIPAFAAATSGPAPSGLAGIAPVAAADPFVALTEQLLHTHLTVWGVLGVTIVKLLAFVGFMVVVGRRIIPFILHATAHTGSRELFRLAVLAIALGVAAGAAYLFGVSLALGAFFAGMILSESELSHRAAQETLPLRDAFGVLFFVSVGMLFDPSIIVREPLPVIATLAIILFGKSLIGFLLLALFRQPVSASLFITAALAQIGEFSFILAALGVSLNVLPLPGRDLILAGAIISIILNPVLIWAAERFRPRLEAGQHVEPELGPVVPDTVGEAAALAEEDPEDVQPTGLRGHVVLIGYGRVGSVVAAELQREHTPFVLIEDADGRVHAAREAHIEVIVGNAATPRTLRLANATEAHCIVIAIPNAFEAGQATEQCRKLNPSVRIIARAHSEEEIAYLQRLGADEVIMGEREIGLGMIDWLNGVARRDAASAAPAPRLSGSDNLLRQARAGRPATETTASPAELLGLDERPESKPKRAGVPALLGRRGRGAPTEPRVEPALPAIELPVPADAPTESSSETPAAIAAVTVVAATLEPEAPTPVAEALLVTEPPAIVAEPSPEPEPEKNLAVAPEPAPEQVPVEPSAAGLAETAVGLPPPPPEPNWDDYPTIDAEPVAVAPAHAHAIEPTGVEASPPEDVSPSYASLGTQLEPESHADEVTTTAAAPEWLAAAPAAAVWDVEPPPAHTASTVAAAPEIEQVSAPELEQAAPAPEVEQAVEPAPEVSIVEPAPEAVVSAPMPDARAPEAAVWGEEPAPAATASLEATPDGPAESADDMVSVSAPIAAAPTAVDAVDAWADEPTSVTSVPGAWLEPSPAERPRASPGVRVIPSSEIIILPPGAEEPPVAPGHYWIQEEPLPGADETGAPGVWDRSAAGTVEGETGTREASWMAGLERDLFGENAASPADDIASAVIEAEMAGPNETPQPVPQPVETPHPAEVPQPAPEPLQDPPPREEPMPAPQTPEIPTPQVPDAPPPRADAELQPADGDDRKEPPSF